MNKEKNVVYSDPKLLESVEGCDVILKYDKEDKIASILLNTLGEKGLEPIEKAYWECVDETGKSTFISEDYVLVLSVAGRFGYNYRQVKYNLEWEEEQVAKGN